MKPTSCITFTNYFTKFGLTLLLTKKPHEHFSIPNTKNSESTVRQSTESQSILNSTQRLHRKGKRMHENTASPCVQLDFNSTLENSQSQKRKPHRRSNCQERTRIITGFFLLATRVGFASLLKKETSAQEKTGKHPREERVIKTFWKSPQLGPARWNNSHGSCRLSPALRASSLPRISFAEILNHRAVTDPEWQP